MNIDDLICAFERMMTTKHELDECVRNCDHSPGYFCASQSDRYQKATKEFSRELEKLIDVRACELLVAFHLVAPDDLLLKQIREQAAKPKWMEYDR